MLTRSLALAVIWLLLSAVPTLLWGTRPRQLSVLRSTAWLIFVIVLGDLWALLTFGQPVEIAAFSLLAFLWGIWWTIRLPNWNALGQATWTMSVLSGLLYLMYSFAVTAFSPLHPLGFLLSCILFALEVIAVCLTLSFTYEMFDVVTRVRWNHTYKPAKPIPGYAPKISLHVPTYNEPPDVVEATLRSLAKLDYPNFEVLLVDNNTPDETTWRPLEAVCRELGPNFKCLHLHRWPGYKSGALNFALTQTDPEAEIVGIIDADYQVDPEYLGQTAPYFKNPRVGFVQTPQDYREYKGNSFFEGCYDTYKYFFNVSMPSRNEHNAIIFCGTMGLIRKSVLQEVGGWDEWCITEDAEASLRILKRGYRSVYINHAYGHGIMPLNFEGFKKQRFRWCFGGIQVLRKHWESLMPWAHWIDPTNRLTFAQRYYFLAGGVQWFNELVTFTFTVILLLGGLALRLGLSFGTRSLTGAIVTIPLIFLTLGLWRFLWALRHVLKLSWAHALRTMGNFFSLSWVVTLGSIQGLVQPTGVFLRTPKTKTRSSVLRALRVTQWETTLGSLCLILSLFLAWSKPSFTLVAVVLLLLWQGGFYLSSPAISLTSEREQALSRQASSRGDIQGRLITENWASRWMLGFGVMVIIGIGLLTLLPAPKTTPDYTQFQPAELQPQEILGGAAIPTTTLAPQPSPVATPGLGNLTATPALSLTPTPTDLSTLQPTKAAIWTEPPKLPPATPTILPFLLTSTSSLPPLPTQVPTQPPLPTQVPTQPPLPTQIPTKQPLPTQAPTPKPIPTQAPTQKPQPTSQPLPTLVPTPRRH